MHAPQECHPVPQAKELLRCCLGNENDALPIENKFGRREYNDTRDRTRAPNLVYTKFAFEFE